MTIYSIYVATNQINNKVYVGFDSCWPSRKNDHKSVYLREDSPQQVFYRALKKYGWDNFVWEVVYQSTNGYHTLNVMENYFITKYNSYVHADNTNGYNMTLGGEGVLGRKASTEQKQRKSEATSKQHRLMTPEQKLLRATSCSIGQQKRYSESSDSVITRKRKSQSHRKRYKIISPAGEEYVADDGLKLFAELNTDSLGVTYWQLMNALRRTSHIPSRKNANKWVVICLSKVTDAIDNSFGLV